MDMIDSDYQLRRMVTKREIIEGVQREIARHTNDDEAQRSYVQTMETMMAFADERIRKNVEAFLPVSPTACVHVLPLVERSRPVRTPAAEEVNMAQAAFATEHCFTNVYSPEVDATLQSQFGKFRLGIEGFSLRHIDHNKVLFDILMGRRPQGAPPR
jgi:hypothetical protein